MTATGDALDVTALLADAVRFYWQTRASQGEAQGRRTGQRDAGTRANVTGGHHADGFVRLIAAIAAHAGLPATSVRTTGRNTLQLPGYYRPSKAWDVLIVHSGALVAAIEVKSQVGSFGNNFNNRVEEALGNARDFWQAVSKERYGGGMRPWLGYFFMLEDSPASTRPTQRITLDPYPVDEAFQGLSYTGRYEEVCRRMLLERDYDAACFFTSNPEDGVQGLFKPASVDELSVQTFARSLHAHIAARTAIR